MYNGYMEPSICYEEGDGEERIFLTFLMKINVTFSNSGIKIFFHEFRDACK